MRTLVLIISLFSFISCQQHNDDLLREENPVLTGMLLAGETVNGISFFNLAENEIKQIADATLTLSDTLGHEVVLIHGSSGYYAPSFMVVANRNYSLQLQYNGKQISSKCMIPPSLVLVNITTNEATIDPSTDGAPLLTVTWNELDNEKYSYALLLENLESTKTTIPFSEVTGGQFEILYDTPVLNNSVTLFDTDFKYYGQHRLTVFAIERSLEDVYFYNSSDIRGLLQSGPNNVKGAHGYFAGASSFSVEMLIE